MYKLSKIDPKYFAKLIIEANGLLLYKDEPFTTRSGLKELFFLDHRLLYANPEARYSLANGLVHLTLENYEIPEIIVGVAMGAVPLATMVADKMGLPLAYVRPATKEYSTKKLVEGVLPEGAKTIIIEDVIIKATSTIHAYNAIRQVGGEVLGVASIYNQKLQSMYNALEELHLENHSLYDIDVLLEFALENKHITKERYDEIMDWRKDPEQFSANYKSKTIV